MGSENMQELKELNITMTALSREERFDEFFNLFEPTVSLALEEQNFTILIDLYWNRSRTFYQLGDIQSCIADLKKASEWIDEYGTIEQKIKYFNSFAAACGELGNKDKYLEYLNKAKDLAIQYNDLSLLCNIYNNLSVHYIDIGQSEDAVELLTKCLKLSQQFYEENGYDIPAFLHIRLNLAKAYTELHQFSKAEELFKMLFSYIEGKKMVKTSIYVYQYKGLWYKKQKRYEEACEILEKAKGFALNNNDLIQLEEINKTLVEIMTELNDKDRLIAIQKDYINILLKLKEINLNQNLMQIEVSQSNKQYESMTTKDPLTNCYNRHYFEKNIKEWLLDAHKTDDLIGFIIFDVDYFKEVNDKYGHLAGDDVLKRIAYEANLCLANYNSFLARYGGDEFIAILKVENLKELQSIVENLHKHLTSLVIEVNDQKIPIHISIGVSTNYCGMITDEKEIFKLADDALYKSKRNGRNQYTVN